MLQSILYPPEIQNVEDLYERPDIVRRLFCEAESIRDDEDE